MQEKRRYERFLLDDYEIDISMALADQVQILDMSEGDISFKADLRLNIGRQYILTIKTKHNVSKIKGIIVWSSLIENKEDAKGDIVPIYKAGLQFTNVSREAINEIIASLRHKKEDINIRDDSSHVNLGLEYLDIQEEDQAKLERVIDSLC